MFQDFALFPHLTILDNVRFGLTALENGAARNEAMHALGRVGLTHYADKYPHVLSGGEQQRVALARALAPRPAVILMDEPFSGLDSRLKDSVRADTLAILREARATAIVVTHDAEEAMRMSDRIALLRGGKLVQVGSSDDLYRRPVDIFATSFFSEVNLFEGMVSDGRVQTPLGHFSASGIADGKLVDVAIRLQGVRVETDGAGVPARVISRRFLGVVDLFTFAVAGCDEPVRARIRADGIPQGLRDVALSVNERDTLVFEKAAISD
jgi:iron(III) transport system ATP-binding protein